jgi:hypothetical protein
MVEQRVIGENTTAPRSNHVISEVHGGNYHTGERMGYNQAELHGSHNGRVAAHHHVQHLGLDGNVTRSHGHHDTTGGNRVEVSRVGGSTYEVGRTHGATYEVGRTHGGHHLEVSKAHGLEQSTKHYGGNVVHSNYNSGYRTSYVDETRYVTDTVIDHVPEQRRSIRKSEKIVKGEPRLVDTVVVNEGEFKVIDEIPGQKHIISTHPRESIVTGTTHGESRIISEHITGSRITGTDYHSLGESRHAPRISYVDTSKQVVINKQNPNVVEKIVEKHIEIITEKPVPNYVEKEVIYDVIVEKPIEKIIEREVIKEVIVEKPVEKIVEIAIEKIVEVPIEKIIEKPVYIQEIIEVPIEKIVTEEVEHLVEVPVYNDQVIQIDHSEIGKYAHESILPTIVNKTIEEVHVDKPYYVDNVIKKTIEHPYDNVIEHVRKNEVRKEILNEVEIPVYKDNVIVEEVYVDVPVVRKVQKEYHVEKVIPRINEITKQVPIETIVEKIIHVDKPEYVNRERRVEREVINEVWKDRVVDVEHVVRQPVEIEEIIEHEVIHENIIERPVERIVENKYQVIVEERRDVPFKRTEVVERPYDVIVEVPREVVIEHPVENIIEKKIYIDNVIEREVLEIRDVVHEYENIIERPVYRDNIIEQEVIYETTTQRPYDNIITQERIVEVPRDKIKRVEVIVDRPVKRQKIVEREVIQEKIIGKEVLKEVHVEADIDMNLQIEYSTLRAQFEAVSLYHVKLEEQLSVLRIQWENEGDNTGYWAHEVREILLKIAELEREINAREKQLKSSKRVEKTTTTVYVDHPRVQELNELIMARQNEIAQKTEKISFHNTRISYGTANYRYENDTHGERKVRLSERNRQNKLARITNEYAEIKNPEVRRQIEEAITLRKTQKDVDLIVENFRTMTAN